VPIERPSDSADVTGALSIAVEDGEPINDAHKRGCDKQGHDYAGDQETDGPNKPTPTISGAHNVRKGLQRVRLRPVSRRFSHLIEASRLYVCGGPARTENAHTPAFDRVQRRRDNEQQLKRDARELVTHAHP
jgi:hypothetical protein